MSILVSLFLNRYVEKKIAMSVQVMKFFENLYIEKKITMSFRVMPLLGGIVSRTS